MKTLYRFKLSCGRMGELEGMFTAKPEDIEAALGKTAQFGEVLGKHSDISVVLDEGHFELLTDDPYFVEKFELFGCASGFNPLSYLEDAS